MVRAPFESRPLQFVHSVAVLTDDVPLVISRQLLQTFAGELSKLPGVTLKEVGQYALEKVQPRVVSFEEQVRRKN